MMTEIMEGQSRKRKRTKHRKSHKQENKKISHVEDGGNHNEKRKKKAKRHGDKHQTSVSVKQSKPSSFLDMVSFSVVASILGSELCSVGVY